MGAFMSDALLLVIRLLIVFVSLFLAVGAVSCLRSARKANDRARLTHSLAQLILVIGLLVAATVKYWLYGAILVTIGLVALRLNTRAVTGQQAQLADDDQANDTGNIEH